MADLNGPDLPRGYDDTNRAFVQAFMARGTMTFEEAQPVLAEVFTAKRGGDQAVEPRDVTRQDFESYVAAASHVLSKFDYEIRSSAHQVTRKRVYALVNTTSDPMTQLATTYTADELSFIKRVLDAMFESRNSPRMEVMCLNEMDAIKLRKPLSQPQHNGQPSQSQTQGSTDKGLRVSDVERVLASLVGEGWFELSKEGFYSLSPRALMELRSWLVECYNDPDAGDDEWQRIKFCIACKEIVTYGQRCSERDCNVRLHDICQDAFWRSRQSRCPNCSTEWTGDKYVGERAVTMTDAYQRGRRRGGKGTRVSNLAEDIIQQEQEQEDDGEDDGEE